MKIQPKFVILLVIFSGLLPSTVAAAPSLEGNAALLYAVEQSANLRGAISVYDIAAGHRLIKTIHTVLNVGDVRGVAASAVTGKLYVAYIDVSGIGMVYCLNIYNDAILWNRPISPGVDRLAINPDGQLLYVPTWEGGSADYINVVDANTGDVVRKISFSNRSHDTLYPLSGPIFQETKAEDGSGKYLYLIDPKNYAVSRVGPYSDILGPLRRRQYEQLRREQRDAPLGNAGRQSQDRRDHDREPPGSPARGSRVAAWNWLDPRSERGVGEQQRE